jgi:hypothetical protein
LSRYFNATNRAKKADEELRDLLEAIGVLSETRRAQVFSAK